MRPPVWDMSDRSSGRTDSRRSLGDSGVGVRVCDVSRQETCLLPNTLEAPGHARVFVQDVLCTTHGQEALVAVQLVASEMVTEAVLHGAPPYELAVSCQVTEIRVTVSDRSTADRVSPDATDQLREALIGKVTRDRGVDLTGQGRTQWCVVATGHIPRPRSPFVTIP